MRAEKECCRKRGLKSKNAGYIYIFIYIHIYIYTYIYILSLQKKLEESRLGLCRRPRYLKQKPFLVCRHVAVLFSVSISTCGMTLDTNFPTKRDNKSKPLKENKDFDLVQLYAKNKKVCERTLPFQKKSDQQRKSRMKWKEVFSIIGDFVLTEYFCKCPTSAIQKLCLSGFAWQLLEQPVSKG